jgi:4-carboxymuconolactone decarboxylase
MALDNDEEPLAAWRDLAADVRDRFHPSSGQSALAGNPWSEFDGDFAALVGDLAMGGAYAGPELDLKTRALCSVAALVACGEQRYATNWMRNALNVGATTEELVALLRQLFFYLGTPRTVAGFTALKDALAT